MSADKQVPKRDLLSISWNHGCAVGASPECHLPQVGLQYSVATASSFVLSLSGFVTRTMTVADGEPQLHFLLMLPVAHKKGTIWKEKVRSLKIYMVINFQGPMGCGCAGESREGGARLRYGGGGCASTCLAVWWVSFTGLQPGRRRSVWLRVPRGLGQRLKLCPAYLPLGLN